MGLCTYIVHLYINSHTNPVNCIVVSKIRMTALRYAIAYF